MPSARVAVQSRRETGVLEKGVACAIPTTSWAQSLGAGCPVLPSRATIAPPARRGTPWAAIGNITNGGTDDTRTQHWPRPMARTNAPLHTLTTWLPSTSTSWHWKIGPVSPSSTNEDENGDATGTVIAACVRWVMMRKRSGGSAVVGGVVRALVKRARPIVHLPLVPPSAALPSATDIALNGNKSLLHRLPFVPTPPVTPFSFGAAAVSHSNLVDSTKSETAATSSIHLGGAVGPKSSNDEGGIVDVPANLAGTTHPGTPTSPFPAPEAANTHNAAGASVDRHAGVHDDVSASRGLDAWTPAPRLVLD